MIDADDYATHCHKAKVAAQAVYEALINKEYGAAGVLSAAECGGMGAAIRPRLDEEKR